MIVLLYINGAHEMINTKTYLVKQLKDIMVDETLNWEQKHQKIFYDGLKCAFLESVDDTNLSPYSEKCSSNKTECEAFYEWAMSHANTPS